MSKVVNIGTAETVQEDRLLDAVEAFLDQCNDKSKNTADSYRRHYKEFFGFIFSKKPVEKFEWDDVENIGWDDIKNINTLKLMGYRKYILHKNIKEGSTPNDSQKNTVNAKLASIKSLFKYLALIGEDYGYKIKMNSILLLEPFELSKKHKQWGALTQEEYEHLLEYCDGLAYRPFLQRMFFETAEVTASRKEALLNIKWSDIFQRIEDGKKVWVISVLDKRNDYAEISIFDDFHMKLMEMKKYLIMQGVSTTSDDYIFDINEDTLDKTLKNFCKKEGIPASRNIVIHSLKKSSMDFAYIKTKDLKLVAEHGHHSSIEMLHKRYCGQNRKLTEMPSYLLSQPKTDKDVLHIATKDQLLQAILQCDESIQNMIIAKLKGE